MWAAADMANKFSNRQKLDAIRILPGNRGGQELLRCYTGQSNLRLRPTGQ
jgi:hypothetical protein